MRNLAKKLLLNGTKHRKAQLIKWKDVCRSKRNEVFGGLGGIANVALLGKWHQRFPKEQHLRRAFIVRDNTSLDLMELQ